MENKVGRALRRGVALGLTLAAAWTLSLTADLTGVGGRLAALGEDPALCFPPPMWNSSWNTAGQWPG